MLLEQFVVQTAIFCTFLYKAMFSDMIFKKRIRTAHQPEKFLCENLLVRANFKSPKIPVFVFFSFTFMFIYLSKCADYYIDFFVRHQTQTE